VAKFCTQPALDDDLRVLLGGMVFLFLRLPTSFLPLEDRGMFTTSVQLPSGATQQQTLKVVQS
jgi:multidrug efflux pump